MEKTKEENREGRGKKNGRINMGENRISSRSLKIKHISKSAHIIFNNRPGSEFPYKIKTHEEFFCLVYPFIAS